MILILISLIKLSIQTYTQKEGLEYYYYSSVAFCPQDQIIDWSCEYPCKNTTGMTHTSVIYNPFSNVYGFVGYQSKTDRIVISLRGSIDWKNYLEDATFFLQPYEHCDKCQIHTGFYADWKSVQEQTAQKIRTISETKEIYVTGHSLGAALATVAAIELKMMGLNVVGLYNYGSPRVGNKQFAQFVQDQIEYHYRIVHYYDLFTSLPPRLFGFYHIAQEVWQMDYNGEQIKICDPEDGEDQSCSDSREFYKLRTSDHTTYFGFPNTCSGQ